MRVVVLMLACPLAVAGCAGLFGGKDNTPPPAELTDFTASVEIETVWERDVGAGAGKGYLNLRPAVDGDRVYAADHKGRLRAFDAKTGKQLWSTATKSPISGGPGAGDGLVLAGTSDGEVVALSAEDGAIAWRARVSSEVLSAPDAHGGVTVARTIDGKLFGLRSTDGSRLWVYDRTVPVLSLRGTSSPVLTDRAALAGFDSGRLVSVALDNGQPLWETRVAIPSGRSELERMVDIDADPLVVGNTVYVVTFQGQVAAVDLRSGEVIWRRDMSSHAGLGADPANVYVTDEQSHVWALDRGSSASMWRQAKLEARGLTPPAVFGDFVVVGDFQGYVHWLRREDGQFAARVRVDGNGIAGAPVATRFAVYVYGKAGTLAALRVNGE